MFSRLGPEQIRTMGVMRLGYCNHGPHRKSNLCLCDSEFGVGWPIHFVRGTGHGSMGVTGRAANGGCGRAPVGGTGLGPTGARSAPRKGSPRALVREAKRREEPDGGGGEATRRAQDKGRSTKHHGWRKIK